MVAVHKMLRDTYEESFTLIAIHSGLEDYALVYALNLYLKSKFKRAETDLDIAEDKSFPIFEWKDAKNDRGWTLLQNAIIKEHTIQPSGFFKDEIAYKRHHLLPEHKEVDYFLKIENEEFEIDDEDIVKSILTIPNIVTAYTMEANKLKSKNNLIF